MIEVRNLVKYYGSHMAVDHLNFTIQKGQIYGFLGPTGAGKSTTMNIMTGYLGATEGQVLINGHDILTEPYKAKRDIGYLPEQPPLYMNETPAEYLRFVGETKGVHGAELKRQIDEVMEQTRITQMRSRRISQLSKGYRQRVGIAQALMGSPRVVILDEPTVGLDPIQIVEIRELIRDLGRSHTVILSSHILSEVQTICEEILIISRGKLVAFGRPGDLERQLLSPSEINLVAETGEKEAREILEPLEHITQADFHAEGGERVAVCLKTDQTDIHDISRDIFFAFARRGTALLEMNLKKANLEDVFLELTEKDQGGSAENKEEEPA